MDSADAPVPLFPEPSIRDVAREDERYWADRYDRDLDTDDYDEAA
ncbi:hypothetical protein [Streptomyces nigrescens]|uniref:SAM-dependent methyltransferase n=1 Tax=Streptomyces nigrescens TaxID=1920 RepID=A0ABY7IAT0_STRNI|nr:hypothetical protein [Streptomyces libani]WAT94950.1 hypothetical protein STRLI_000622 [Streptomyces libani subsp. libani]